MTSERMYYRNRNGGSWTSWKKIAYTTDNVSTSSKLATARKINGTNFDGSADITTVNWGTARNIKIADSDGTNTGAAVSVNGGGDATLKLPATIKASLAGNASTASKLATARTITLSGSVTGSANFDGSGNITISTSTNHSHSYLPLAGGVMTGNINFNNRGTSYIGNGNNDSANGVGGALNNLIISSWWGVSFTTSCPGQAYSNTNAVSIDCRSGEVMAAKFSGPLNGNANTASKLASARNIALTGAVTGNANFDGSGNININTTVNHGHNYVPLSGGTMSGMLQFNAGFGIQSTVADNDFWRILGGGSSNNGYLEIATADDGSEPIYLRQYTGVFSNLVRTATLLDGNGNTSFPGTVSASSFNGNANTATKATQDSAGQQINTTYIKGLSVSGRTITYTKGDGSTGTITTQDNNTTYPIGYKTIDAKFASK